MAVLSGITRFVGRTEESEVDKASGIEGGAESGESAESEGKCTRDSIAAKCNF